MSVHASDPATRLSERILKLKPSATLAVTARVAELRAAGRDVIGFGAGEPDFETPDNIKQAAIDALHAGRTHYAPVPGDPDAREAIAAKLQRDNGIACSADDVVITVGAKHALFMALQCLIDPGRGREVVLPAPAWVSYRPMIELAGGVAVEVPGSIDNDLKITPSQLAGAITARTVAVVINSPSNPCGTMYTPAEIEALIEVLAEHETVTVISDEIYEKLVYGGIEHQSPGAHRAIAHRAITVNGLSKAYAMTGWRIGYACGPGPAAGRGMSLAKAIAKLQSQMTSCIASFVYPAIREALDNSGGAVETMRRAFAERAALVHELVSAWPDVRCPKPTGAFYVFPDVSAHYGRRSPGGREIEGSVSFAEALLEDTGVAVVPGADFGECAEGHVRLSFACAPEAIREGCGRVDAWLRRLH